MLFAIIIASIAWFLAAAALFFNPLIDPIYRSEEQHAAVKSLPKSPKTVGKILLAILIQVILWALVYAYIGNALPGGKLQKGLLFSLILVTTKIIPRDVDRLLLTTYPNKRMTIEFIVGVICSFIVGLVFSHFM